MQKGGEAKKVRKSQSQPMPGLEAKMDPKPVSLKPQPRKNWVVK
jgi:hypothetical protein